MSVKLERDLRIYMSYLDTLLPSITADQLAEPVVALSPAAASPQPAPRRGWIVAATAATIAVVLLLGSLIVISSGSTNDPAPVATTPPIASYFSLSWSRVPHDEGIFGDKVPFTDGMSDVTVGGPGLVAVGEGDDGSAVWTSVDGITWSRVPHDEAVFGGAEIRAVTIGGPGLVAIGSAGDDSTEHSETDVWTGDAAVWTSVDGITWSRVPHDEAVFGGAEIRAVTIGGPGLVAVGWDRRSESGEDAAVWTSVDGITWSRVPHDEAVFGGEGAQTMNSVTVGGPGLVAVGSDSFLEGTMGQLTDYGDFTGVAAVWTSVDGLLWSRVPTDEAVFGGEGNQWINAVSSSGSGLVAVGGDWSSAAHDAAVWTSVDGITWSRVPNDEAVFGGREHDQLMLSVTTAGSGVVAVGRAWAQSGGDHFAGSDDSAASVWTTEDGTTWSWLGYDEAVFGSEDNSSFLLSDGPVFTEYRQWMSSVTATDWGVVAVGADWSGPSHGAAVWVAVPEG